MRMPIVRPTILALDLEGTLISTAYSQIPQPGLRHFLTQGKRLVSANCGLHCGGRDEI